MQQAGSHGLSRDNVNLPDKIQAYIPNVDNRRPLPAGAVADDHLVFYEIMLHGKARQLLYQSLLCVDIPCCQTDSAKAATIHTILTILAWMLDWNN